MPEHWDANQPTHGPLSDFVGENKPDTEELYKRSWWESVLSNGFAQMIIDTNNDQFHDLAEVCFAALCIQPTGHAFPLM